MSFLPGSPFLGLQRRRVGESAPAGPVAPSVLASGPKVVGTSNPSFYSGSIYPGLQAGDQILVFAQTANQGFTMSGDWTELSASPQGTGVAAAADATRITVFRHVVDGTTEPSPATTFTGDNFVGSYVFIRGAHATINAIAGATEATADTSVEWPSVTTTADECLVLLFGARSLPDTNTNDQASGYTNANLTGLTEVVDYNVATGNGGGVFVASGVMDAAGAVGTSTATLLAAASKGVITLALAPAT